MPVLTSEQRLKIYNTTLTDADTEYPLTLPSNVVSFTVQARQFNEVKLAFVSGESGTTYWTIKAGSSYPGSHSPGGEPATLILYMQSAVAGTVVEVVATGRLRV